MCHRVGLPRSSLFALEADQFLQRGQRALKFLQVFGASRTVHLPVHDLAGAKRFEELFPQGRHVKMRFLISGLLVIHGTMSEKGSLSLSPEMLLLGHFRCDFF